MNSYPSELLDRLFVRQGDITRERVDAIVNAANPALLGGGGVDGAIHRAAGPGLLEECRRIGGCRHGEARITGGYNLSARHVIHTPGPVYKDGASGERETLRSSYRTSMDLAMHNGLRSIAFPAISTGVYGYPAAEACEVAVYAVLDFMAETGHMIDVYFILFDNNIYYIYSNFIEALRRQAAPPADGGNR
ncbi:MAG TPA: O-acetyl-ADP-ribose deacetylase [Spirochaetota bacterium]|nr:O-acetyl-ADP-ribose deacetylase [Spirochaetota bacterium]